MQHFRPRGRKHSFLLSIFEHFGGRETEKLRFRDFVPKRYHLCFKKVVRLDGCVAFSQIEPKTSNLEWENVVVVSFRMEFGKVGNVTFPITKSMVWRGPNPRFSGRSIMCYVLKHE